MTDTLTTNDLRGATMPAPPPRSANRAATPQTPITPAKPPRSAPWSGIGAGGRKFRLPEIVVGVLLVAGCALAALLLQRSDSERTTIVVSARDITRGSVITAQDLTGRNMSGDTTMMITGDQAKSLLGQVATLDITAGTPLTPTLVQQSPPLEEGEALTSVALEPGRVPPDLAPNDTVQIVVVTSSGTGGADQAELLDVHATVWSIAGGDDLNSNTIVTLRGPSSLTAQLATASTVQIARIEGE